LDSRFIEKCPDKVEISKKILSLKEGVWKSKAYIYFIFKENPNKPSSIWQHKESITIKDNKEGTIVIDILEELSF
jgi:hypothetical protein